MANIVENVLKNQTANKVADVLNKLVANWSVLYVKLHHYHWYVRGPQFFALHAKFEELYNEAAAHVDALAERVLTIGGCPASTMKEYLELATVKEAAGGESAEQMVAAVVADLQQIASELKEGITIADSAGDEATVDMLVSLLAGVEKHIWMLNAFIGK